MDVRPQIPGLRIYRLIFLFDPDGKSRFHRITNNVLSCRANSCPASEARNLEFPEIRVPQPFASFAKGWENQALTV
jgi:hypothetical protein